MKIFLCSLPSAEALRQVLYTHLRENAVEVIEISGSDPAKIAAQLADRMGDEVKKAVFLGETGIDVYARAAMHANLAPVVCHNPLQAEELRKTSLFHTLCMGSRIIKSKYAISILDVWLINDMMEENCLFPQK